MAKKQTKVSPQADPGDEHVEQVVVKTPPVVEQPKETKSKNPEDKWEIKNRLYYLTKNRAPLTYLIRGSNIFWFDEEKGYERELKYTSNQRTCFVDEMKGEQRLEHIIFEKGHLFVPKEKTVLQKMLSLYHPHKDILFEESKPAKKAASEIDIITMEINALNAAQALDINMAEAIMRVEVGSRVSEMSSSELKRDLLIFSKRNPKLFLELVNDDNVQLRNFGIKATEMGIIKLSGDQRNFMWGSNDRKLMNIPFDEHPYSALAAWFKTDEGMEVYQNIEKRLNQ